LELRLIDVGFQDLIHLLSLISPRLEELRLMLLWQMERRVPSGALDRNELRQLNSIESTLKGWERSIQASYVQEKNSGDSARKEAAMAGVARLSPDAAVRLLDHFSPSELNDLSLPARASLIRRGGPKFLESLSDVQINRCWDALMNWQTNLRTSTDRETP
jgi:hypothetical protein